MEFDEGENIDLIVDEGVIAVVVDEGDGHGVVVDDLEAFFDLLIRHNQPFFIQEDLAATATTILPTLAHSARTLPSQYDILDIVSHIDILTDYLSLWRRRQWRTGRRTIMRRVRVMRGREKT